jgi:CBS domain-containing protein
MDTVAELLKQKGAEVVTVPAQTRAIDVARTMSEKRIGAVLIANGPRPSGIVSERDLMTRVILKGLDPATTTAEQVMSRDLVVVSPSTPIREAMAVMTQQRVRHLPVVEENRLAGIISIGDCTKWVSQNQEFTIRHLSDYIADKYPR